MNEVNIYSFAGMVSAAFFIAKFVEVRFSRTEADATPIKYLVQDAIIVYISVVVINFVMSSLMLGDTVGGGVKHVTEAFTDNPAF
jgi:hypothetical protein